MGPNVKAIKNKVKSLKIPRAFWGIDIDSFFEYQWNVYMSIRQTAGKTTQSLLYGLCLNAVHPDRYVIEYLRWDDSQIVRSNIETIFDTIIKFGYIDKIYNGRWNSVIYKYQTHKFFLCLKNGDGEIIDTDDEPICIVHSIQKWSDMKSSYVNNKGNYIILDECFDSSRATYTLFVQLLHVISTIGRPLAPERRDWLHILLLGNNTDEYSFLFDDFNVDVSALDFGGSITFRTEYNTNGIIRLLELGEEQKKRLEDKNIPFLGFPGKKAATFTGAATFSGKQYRHIDFELDYDECIFRRIYVKHRGRYIQLDLFRNEDKGKFVFAHFASAPKYNDNLILTIEPDNAADIYGFGKYCKKEKPLKVLKTYTGLLQENRFYYASNKCGSLIDDFIKNIV